MRKTYCLGTYFVDINIVGYELTVSHCHMHVFVLGLKQPGREMGNSSSFNAEIKNGAATHPLTPAPPWCGV